MKKRTVELTISQLINDLNNGMTWLEKDNEGYGSIQNKYGAKDVEILTIQKHPKLKDLEPSITVFNIIDDLKDESTEAATPATKAGKNQTVSAGLFNVDLEAPTSTLEEETASPVAEPVEDDGSFDKL